MYNKDQSQLRQWRTQQAVPSGAVFPTSLKLASEVVNVDFVDLEVIAVADAINDDRIDSLV